MKKLSFFISGILAIFSCWPLDSDNKDENSPAIVIPSIAGNEIVEREFFHKLTTEVGYGPEDEVLGGDRKNFYTLRYEPSFFYYWPEKNWANFEFAGRAIFNYEHNQISSALSESNYNSSNSENRRERARGGYAELREIYLRRKLINGDPRFSASIGRQRFSSRYGFWWDDSIESLNLHYQGALSQGFFAVAQKFWNYNSDVNKLDPSDKNVLYAFGEYSWNLNSKHQIGVRSMLEYDHSKNSTNDSYDFQGARLGLFLHADEGAHRTLPVDYHFEVIALLGDMTINSSSNSSQSHDVYGWALLSEAGWRFEDQTWQPRWAMHGGITDHSSNDYDGFRLNNIQSDRRTMSGSYNSRLVSSLVRLNLRNLAYFGVALQLKPSARSQLDFRLSSLHIRNPKGDLPVQMAREYRSSRRSRLASGDYNNSHGIGEVLDINYFTSLFPRVISGRHLNLSALLSASYLRAGAALDSGDEYQISLAFILRY
jgi:alginate production protein